jgi:hypothetical protein
MRNVVSGIGKRAGMTIGALLGREGERLDAAVVRGLDTGNRALLGVASRRSR